MNSFFPHDDEPAAGVRRHRRAHLVPGVVAAGAGVDFEGLPEPVSRRTDALAEDGVVATPVPIEGFPSGPRHDESAVRSHRHREMVGEGWGRGRGALDPSPPPEDIEALEEGLGPVRVGDHEAAFAVDRDPGTLRPAERLGVDLELLAPDLRQRRARTADRSTRHREPDRCSPTVHSC